MYIVIFAHQHVFKLFYLMSLLTHHTNIDSFLFFNKHFIKFHLDHTHYYEL